MRFYSAFLIIFEMLAGVICEDDSRWSKLLSLLNKKLDYYVHNCWRHKLILDTEDMKRLKAGFDRYMTENKRRYL